MGNVIITAILILIVAGAVCSTVRRIRYGSSCCGTKELPEKRIKVKDKNKAHYTYTYVVKVDGMHCANCARRVENALNEGDGRWAIADVGQKEVRLLSKQAESEDEIRKAIAAAGYTMLSMQAL